MESGIFKRTTALEVINNDVEIYKRFNPLFKKYMSVFDSAFDRGVAPDLNYYVTRNDQDGQLYEDSIANLLVAEHSNSIGKVYVLQGNVGSGKTMLCSYLSEKHTKLSADDRLVIKADVWPTEEHSDSGQVFLTNCHMSGHRLPKPNAKKCQDIGYPPP